MTRAAISAAATRVLFLTGALIVALAIVWWWLSYREVYENSYLSLPQAGVCLVQDSVICRLAASLCRSQHPLAFLAYSATAFWAGVAAVFGGAVARAWRPA